MTALQQRNRTSDTEGDGGVPARRAVVRWAWRLFRREWRSQVLVLALLILAVAASIGGAAAAFNLAPATGNAEFGAASQHLEFEDPDPQGLTMDIDAAGAWFGTIDVIGRRFFPVPGLFEPVELRAQDPTGPFSGPMLALVEGRYPMTATEVAATGAVAEILDVGLGGTFDLGDTTWTVVGMVENPSDLSDAFFLMAPGETEVFESVTILVDGGEDRARAFRAPSGATPVAAGRPDNEDVLAAVGVLIAASVILLLVSLVAAAGFIVVAQRRLRQLGMLAAVGATESHLRLVVVANGAVIGVMAAITGTAVGLVGWILVVPGLETAVGHRIAPFNVPWWLIGTSMVLAVATATAAAWWPARAVARVPIVSALSGRPPRPQPTRRSAAMAGPLVIIGLTCLVFAGDPLDGWGNVVLIIAGTLSFILGILLFTPVMIRAAARFGIRSSVALRLALRDVARYQARSGAALAAISLALGIAAAIVIATSAALYASAAEGNLSASQLMVRIGGDMPPMPDRTPAEVERLDIVVDDIAEALDQATVTPIDVAIAPDLEGFDGLHDVVLTEQVEPGLGRILTFLYLASPEILEHYEVDLDTFLPETEVLTVETGELWFEPMSPELVENSEQLTLGYTSLPGSFITPSALRGRGWESARAAWLIETTTPISEDQSAVARELAANAGITVEARSSQANLVALRTGATAFGMLVAFGILAMTVGLIRSESSGDLRVLAATGATSRIRRSLTAATAGGLAALGVAIGTTGAYLGLAAAHAGDIGELSPVPFGHLLVLVFGIPLVATAGGWILAGREPSTLARGTLP